MPIVIDPVARRIVLDSTSVSAREIYAAWVDWVVLSDNAKWLPAFRSVGGDDLGGGISIPAYYFLTNNWRVRPMEANQTLSIDGNLFVDGGGDPVVQTLGDWRVLVKLVVPVQAQAVSTSGGGAGLTTQQAQWLERLAKINGLVDGVPAVVTPTARIAGDVAQSITEAGGQVTVAMQ
jgi:hypothetical protein